MRNARQLIIFKARYKIHLLLTEHSSRYSRNLADLFKPRQGDQGQGMSKVTTDVSCIHVSEKNALVSAGQKMVIYSRITLRHHPWPPWKRLARYWPYEPLGQATIWNEKKLA